MVMKKKLLFVSNYPLSSSASAAIRNKAIITGFLNLGWEIHTLTKKDDLQNLNDKVIQNFFVNSNVQKVVSNIKKDSLLWELRVKFANILSDFSVYDNQRLLLKNLEKLKLKETNYDLVISSSDSKVSHKIVDELFKLKQIYASNWVQYWGDPFALDLNKSRFVRKSKIKKEEAYLLSKADVVLYTSPFTLEKQKKLYSEYATKMYFIPTPFEETRVYKMNQNEKKLVAYHGSYFRKDRNLEPFYKAITKLPEIDFEIIGSGDLKMDVLENLFIHTQVPYSEILKREEKCDLLICVSNKGEANQIPGKLYHYAATNKPILFIYDKGSRPIVDYFSKFNRYYFCENDSLKIEKKIKEILFYSRENEYVPITTFYCESIVKEIMVITGL